MRNIRTRSRVVAAAVALLAACDTSVTNPGPIPDERLNDPLAYSSLVVGSRLALARSYGSDATNGGQLAYWGGAVAFEIVPAGSTGSFGIPTVVQTGVLTPQITSDDWEAANQARFTAEDVLRRFAEVGARDTLKRAKPSQIAEVALYGAYANRALGENFCGAVLPLTNPDGSLSPGDSTAHTDYFLRAEQHFTNAIQTLGTATGALLTAAYAGRASVRLDLATWGVTSPGVATVAAMWDSAAADAGRVTSNTFVFQLPFSNQEQSQYNYIYWSSANLPYRAHTQWGTFHEGYYRASRDLADANPLTYKPDVRARWDSSTGRDTLGDAAVAKFGGRIRWWPERKHASESAPINLSSGWEMRLIEAEYALARNSDAGTAVDKMNLRRSNLSLPLYDNTVAVDSAWTLLKRERGIELWLEARRLGDLRRWIVNGLPGNLYDGLYRTSRTGPLLSTPAETMTSPVARSLCFPIGQSEHDTNPNIP